MEEIKRPTTTTPSLKYDPTLNAILDKQAILAEIELVDTAWVYDWNPKKSRGDLADHYKIIGEAYVLMYEDSIGDELSIITVDGVLVEMYSDIFKHEKLKGESDKSKNQKDRLVLIKSCIERLRKYISKYNQMKIILNRALSETAQFRKENSELKEKLQKITDAHNYE